MNTLLTIFTPTFNRAFLLSRVYESLLIQTVKDFEWIIVDDGSVDDTEKVVNGFISENKIKIIYQKQNNRGKHYAINKGVSLASGTFFLILDSDDALPKDAVEFVFSKSTFVFENKKLGGIAGRRNTAEGAIVGNQIFQELISNSIDIRFKYNVTGDLVEIFKTEVLKEFPFPEIANEKFCPEALVWNRIAIKYDLLFCNKGIYTTEYLPDGLTAKIVKIRMTSPLASMIMYSELANYDIPLLQKVRATINFWRFAYNFNGSFASKFSKVNSLISSIAIPLGYIMFRRDLKKFGS
jgi:glycosyltransferase involved in cell wall biosynthesis